MRCVVLLGIAATLLCGCQSGSESAAGTQAAAPPEPVADVPAPSSTEPTSIGLLVQKGELITVGSSPDKAFEAYKDARYSGSESDELPAKFKDPYRARVWETAHMGFGEVLYQGKLVAAIYHAEKVQQDRVNELLQMYTEQFGAPAKADTFDGDRVNYTFWDVATQRLMICAFHSRFRGIEVTVAMGDDTVLDNLEIAPRFARRDQGVVDSATAQPPSAPGGAAIHPG